MLALEWNRIAIVYVNDTYGRVSAKMLQDHITKYNICVSKVNVIRIDESRRVEITEIKEILSSFVIQTPSIEGVVFFGDEVVANQVMRTFDGLMMTDAPIFILSESSLDKDVFLSHAGSLLGKTKGTLALSLQKIEVPEFVKYWESLLSNKTALLAASENNPFLKDVFRHFTNCDVEDESCMALSKDQIAATLSKLHYVHYAIFAAHTLVKAIQKFNDTVCNGACNSIEKFKSYYQPYRLVEAMDGLSVSYDGIRASFKKDTPNIQLAEGETEYEVYNFRKNPDNNNEFTFVKVCRF